MNIQDLVSRLSPGTTHNYIPSAMAYELRTPSGDRYVITSCVLQSAMSYDDLIARLALSNAKPGASADSLNADDFINYMLGVLRNKAMTNGKESSNWGLAQAIAEAVYPAYGVGLDVLKAEVETLKMRLAKTETLIQDLQDDKKLTDASWGVY